jgi:iron complex outermembrane recepter protein
MTKIRHQHAESKSSLKRRVSLIAIASWMVGALLTEAHAQQVQAQAQSGVTLEVVTVTAQRRSEDIQDVPISAIAVSSKQLEASGVVDTMSLPTVVSGLTVQVQANSFSPRIRGIGTSALGPGIENPVALYVDDVYYGSQGGALVDLVDVSQVTVLKGPQGTLFGRNTTGGVIQLATRDPEKTSGGQIRTELDNYLTWRNNAYVTGGLSDTLAANLSLGYTTQSDGWGENIFDGEDNHRISHDFAARSKWIFTPSDRTLMRFNVDYRDRSDSMAPNLVPAPGTTPRVQVVTPTSNKWDSNSPLDTETDLENYGGSFDFEHDFGFANLVSISAYRKFKIDAQFEPALGPRPEISQFYTFESEQFTQEVRFVSPDDQKFQWVAGAYYYTADDSEPFFQQINVNEQALPFLTQDIRAESSMNTDSWAVFGQGTLEVFRSTRLTLGARYTAEDRDIDGHFFGSFNTLLFPGFPGVPVGGDLDLSTFFPPFSGSKSFEETTYRISLDHDFTPDVLGYVSYNHGFKSGGFNGINPSFLNPAYNPETVDSSELGLKTALLDHRMTLNAAVFYNKYDDIQIISFVNIPTIFNAANAITKGVDVDLQANLTDELRLTAGFEYLHAEFTGDSQGTVVVALPGGGTSSSIGPIDGNTLAYAPEFTGNIALDYTKAFDRGAIGFNVTASGSSSFFGAEDNFVEADGYVNLNSSVTWTSTSGNLSLAIWGRNLLDEAVPAQLANATFGYSIDYTNPPLTYGFTATYRFGK